MSDTSSPQPILSIVIATKNRIPYAVAAIQSILAIDDPELQLVIQDNSDSFELQDFVRANVSDSRFRYRYTPPPFSSIDNFNAAVELATGEYVCLIGDDDGVNPEIMQAVRWAKENGLDALKPKVDVTYLWPGVSVSSFAGARIGGTMSVNHFSGRIRFPNIDLELRKLMGNGGQYYLETDLPRVYHGIVQRDCLQRIRQLTGNYFGGLSPDIYAVTALSTVTRRTAAIDYPLTIAGACPASTSADSAKGRDVGQLVDAPHFRDRHEYQWSEAVPKFYSVQTIWADSALAALQDLNRDELIRDFNIPMLAAHCVWAHPRYCGIVLRDMYRVFRRRRTSRILGTLRFLGSVVSGPGWHFWRRIMNRLGNKIRGHNAQRMTGLTNISEATERMVAILRNRGCSFSACVAAHVPHTIPGPHSRPPVPRTERVSP